MKKLSFLIVVLGLFSCAEKENVKPSEGNAEKSSLTSFNALSVAELQNLYLTADYQIGLFCDANFGLLNNTQQSSSYKMNGVFPSNFVVYIDEVELQSSQENGGFLDRNPDYANLLGKNVWIRAGAANVPPDQLERKQVYFPKPITATRILGQDPQSLYIEKLSPNPKVLTWVPDPNNTLGMVVKYELFDREDYYSPNAITIASELSMAEDDGSYDIGPLINITGVKAVKISLLRANALQFVTPGQDIVAIGTMLADHHFYLVH